MQPVLLVKESPLTSVSFLSEPRGPGSPRGPMGPSKPSLAHGSLHARLTPKDRNANLSHQLGSSLLAGHLPQSLHTHTPTFSLCSPDSVQKPENLKVQVDHVHFCPNLQTASQLTENKAYPCKFSKAPPS